MPTQPDGPCPPCRALSATPHRTRPPITPQHTRHEIDVLLIVLPHRCEQYDMLGALGRNAMDAASSGAAPDPAAKRTFKVQAGVLG